MSIEDGLARGRLGGLGGPDGRGGRPLPARRRRHLRDEPRPARRADPRARVRTAILVKPNQIGTLTETLDTIELAVRNALRPGREPPFGRDRGHDDRRSSPWRPTPARSRPARPRAANAPPSTTGCFGSRRSSASRRGIRAARRSGRRDVSRRLRTPDRHVSATTTRSRPAPRPRLERDRPRLTGRAAALLVAVAILVVMAIVPDRPLPRPALRHRGHRAPSGGPRVENADLRVRDLAARTTRAELEELARVMPGDGGAGRGGVRHARSDRRPIRLLIGRGEKLLTRRLDPHGDPRAHG